MNTSLRNGILHFRIPAGWQEPVLPDKDKDLVGELGLTVGGKSIPPDDAKKMITISGNAVQIRRRQTAKAC